MKKKQQTFEIDLRKMEGEGEFNCPKCGIVISPMDEAGKNYTIIDTRMQESHLEELRLQCTKCGSKIHLSGFRAP